MEKLESIKVNRKLELNLKGNFFGKDALPYIQNALIAQTRVQWLRLDLSNLNAFEVYIEDTLKVILAMKNVRIVELFLSNIDKKKLLFVK